MMGRSKTPLYAHGHTAVCVGEEAAGGEEGSRGTETTRATYWTSSRARSRREGEGVQHKHPLDVRMACQNGGHHQCWHVGEANSWQTLSSRKSFEDRFDLRW